MKTIQQIPINKITPDPNQPRKHFDEQKIKDMAQSYSSQGIINPVEIDKDNIIITGEMRWRAAKIAGLEEIPCIVNETDLKPMDRLLRQCVENAHHSDMKIMDIAKAWKKLLLCCSGSEQHIKAPKSGETEDKGYHWLAQRLGKAVSTIRDTVQLLNESEFVQKHLENEDVAFYQFIRANNAPEKCRNKIKRRIIKKGLSDTTVKTIVNALKKYPEKEKEIFKAIDRSKGNYDIDYEVKSIVKEEDYSIKPDVMSPTEMALKIFKLLNTFEKHLGALSEEIFSELSEEGKSKILISLRHIKEKIDKLL